MYFFCDLEFVLNNLFFPRREWKSGDDFGVWNERPNQFETLTFDFEHRLGEEPNDGDGTCICESLSCITRGYRPHCAGRLGRYLRYEHETQEICDDAARLVHYYQIYAKLISSEGNEGGEGHTTLTPLNKDCKEILTKYWRKSSVKVRRHNFFSCCPLKRIGISEGEVLKLRLFCEKFFSIQYFEKIAWVIESGKHSNSPNLHFHLLGVFNENGSKNFRKRVLINGWNKLYPKNPLDWRADNKVGIDLVACNTQVMIDDKLSYFKNENKGSHKNFVDLKIKGGFGLLD